MLVDLRREHGHGDAGPALRGAAGRTRAGARTWIMNGWLKRGWRPGEPAVAFLAVRRGRGYGGTIGGQGPPAEPRLDRRPAGRHPRVRRNRHRVDWGPSTSDCLGTRVVGAARGRSASLPGGRARSRPGSGARTTSRPGYSRLSARFRPTATCCWAAAVTPPTEFSPEVAGAVGRDPGADGPPPGENRRGCRRPTGRLTWGGKTAGAPVRVGKTFGRAVAVAGTVHRPAVSRNRRIRVEYNKSEFPRSQTSWVFFFLRKGICSSTCSPP